MRADEIFVLVLLVLSIAGIVAMNLHGKRQPPPAAAEADASEPDAAPASEAPTSASRSSRPRGDRRR